LGNLIQELTNEITDMKNTKLKYLEAIKEKSADKKEKSHKSNKNKYFPLHELSERLKINK